MAVAYGKEHQGTVDIEDFEAGANAVLDEMETFINHLNLGNSILEKFHKLDILADIGLFIGELKREK